MSSLRLLPFCIFLFSLAASPVLSRNSISGQDIDEKVKEFLENRRGTWWDMNVPEADGKILYDLIIRQGWQMPGIAEFYDYVVSLPNMTTTIERSSRSGMSLSYKRSEK